MVLNNVKSAISCFFIKNSGSIFAFNCNILIKKQTKYLKVKP